jgi:hypothetical protein
MKPGVPLAGSGCCGAGSDAPLQWATLSQMMEGACADHRNSPVFGTKNATTGALLCCAVFHRVLLRCMERAHVAVLVAATTQSQPHQAQHHTHNTKPQQHNHNNALTTTTTHSQPHQAQHHTHNSQPQQHNHNNALTTTTTHSQPHQAQHHTHSSQPQQHNHNHIKSNTTLTTHTTTPHSQPQQSATHAHHNYTNQNTPQASTSG